MSSEVLMDFRLIEKAFQEKRIALIEACLASFIHLAIQYLLSTYVHDFWHNARGDKETGGFTG